MAIFGCAPSHYCVPVQPWQAGLWGAVGGSVVEAYDFVAAARATRRWPWLDPTGPTTMTQAERWNAFSIWLIATIIRIGAGAGVASAASGEYTGTLVAFTLGVAGPLALERLTLGDIEHKRTTSAPSPTGDRQPVQDVRELAVDPAKLPTRDLMAGEGVTEGTPDAV